jgi:hypothetical protein
MIKKGNVVRSSHQVEIEIDIPGRRTQKDDLGIEGHGLTLQCQTIVRVTRRSRDGEPISEAGG